jgi:Concanavalin A-like lectin/glucanases superfamily
MYDRRMKAFVLVASGKLICSIAFVLALCLLQASTAKAADPSLAGWWDFNEGSGGGAADASNNGNDGTLEGGPNWVAGKIGGGLEFDGTDDYVDCGNDESVNITGAITIAAWIYPTGSGGTTYPRIVDKSSGTGGADAGYKMYLRSAESYRVTLSGGGTFPISSASVELNAWNYLVFITDGTQRKFFLNGVWERWNESALPVVSDNPLFIGNSPAGSRPFQGIIDEVCVYSRALAEEEAEEIMLGLASAELAANPSPASEALDVPRDVVLSWTAGEFAQTHDVYLGTSLDDVDGASRDNPLGVLLSQGQTGTTYESPVVLEYGQTYYWRIDEVNAAPDNTIFRGDLWSFTVEPALYPVANITATSNALSGADEGPENTVNGSGLNENDEHNDAADDMWLGAPVGDDPVYIEYAFDNVYKLHEMRVWNYNVQFELMLGFGFRDVTVEYSENGADWTVLGDVQFAQAPAMSGYTANTTVDFGGVAAQFVRLTVNSGYGPMGQYGLSEVRFFYLPVLPREPQPADGGTEVAVDAALRWRTGREAATHDVYLSTNPDALAMVDSVAEAHYEPADLEFGNTYYWRVDEVNEVEAVSVWQGDVWTFQTMEFATVEDFESYDDEDNRIYDTWLDGWVNETGSTVGYLEEPFAEQTIVNSGAQSMPLYYDNSAAPFYSETERDLGDMDLDATGAEMLRFFVAGQTPPFAEGADGTILMSAIGADIWGAADEFRYAYKNLSGDGAIIAQVDGLFRSNEWVKGGVMIRETLEPGSTFAAVYLTGDYGVRFQARLTADVDAVSDSDVATDEQVALQGPVWVKIERMGNTFHGHYSTDGTTWTAMTWNPQTINMASDVTIGLALTSHNTDVSTGAAFAGVAAGGGVSGNWQTADIGVAQPTASGNAIAPLYVVLEDSAGNEAVVTHPNPAVVGIAAWQEWLIPYSEFTGVNLNSIRTMIIGLGDRNHPTSGGSGTIFIDDVSYGRPQP